MGVAVYLGLIAVLLFVLYRRWAKVYDYWKMKGLPHRKPYILLGNVANHFLKLKSLGEVMADISKEFKREKIVGFYNFTQPAVLINDVDYAEIILIKEFSKFMDRGQDIKLEERRPLDKHLFSLNGTSWKAVRSKMSPVFTAAKLKGMLTQMDKIFDKTSAEIDSYSGKTVNMKNTTELYSICVRATCVFGNDSSGMDQSSEFVFRVRETAKFDFFRFLGLSMALWFPKLATKLNLSFFGAQHEGYFVDNLLATFKERAESNTKKNDLVQTLLELKQTGKVEVLQWTKEDDFLKMDEKHTTKETVIIDDDILLAQSFIFLMVGIETIMTTNVMTLVELSRNNQVLEKVREEVDQVIEKYGQFSYEALKEMEYLEKCIKETLRIYPPVEFLGRRSLKEYTFDNGFKMEKGAQIFIPTLSFHMDSRYFPEPQAYKPERFDEPSFPSCAYMPFGQGPRICLGMRFAMLEMKMYLSKLIYNYKFSLDTANTPLPVTFDKWFFLRRISSPVQFRFTKRTR